MKNKNIILVLFILFCLTPIFVFADMGPKPSVDIHLALNGQKIPDKSFNAVMLICEREGKYYPAHDIISQLDINEYDINKDCYWRPDGSAWGGDCQNSNCSFGYFPPSEFKLLVYLPSQNKVYVSNEVKRENFRSSFEADLHSDGNMDIRETTSFIQSDSAEYLREFLLALFLTLTMEMLIALIYVSNIKISKKILVSVLIANIISLPIVWFVFPLLKGILLSIVLGEIFAFSFETCFIYFFNKEIISLKRSFILSILMNSASLIIGGFIYSVLSMIAYI